MAFADTGINSKVRYSAGGEIEDGKEQKMRLRNEKDGWG